MIAKHFSVVMRHKWVVFKECAACGMPLRGLLHDLSKFSPTEFLSSARYFQGNRSPIEAEKERLGYSKAWLHHKGHNKHHWEYWTDFDDSGAVIANKIPYKYVVEMVCDWVGASKVYENGDWNRLKPLQYYQKVRMGRYFYPETEELIVMFLEKIATDGLVCFHRIARLREIKADYENRQ